MVGSGLSVVTRYPLAQFPLAENSLKFHVPGYSHCVTKELKKFVFGDKPAALDHTPKISFEPQRPFPFPTES